MIESRIMNKKNDNNEPVEKSEKSHTCRRTFLKKTAYVAPTLIALGYLARPTNANALPTSTPDAPAWS
jgi:hypothetical protein